MVTAFHLNLNEKAMISDTNHELVMRTISLTGVSPPSPTLYFMLHLLREKLITIFTVYVLSAHVVFGFSFVALVPQFETRCSYVKATLEEFLAWSSGQPSCLSGPFSCFEYSKYWAYADYKYIARIFEDKAEIFQVKHSYYLLLA